MLETLFNVIAPVLACAAVGYVWAKRGHAFSAESITPLVTAIGTPCLVFSTLVQAEIDSAAFADMAAATTVSIVACFVVCGGVLKLAGVDLRAFLNSTVFGNAGNMGLPLSLLAFGPEGLALAITYLAVYIVFLFTVGVAISAGAVSLGAVARLPVVYAVALALIVMFTEFPVPQAVVETTDILGGLTIPLMLLALGVSLAEMTVSSLRLSLGLSALRLGMGFAVGWGVAVLFGMEGAARGVLILQCAMPVAVFNYLFAARYGTRPTEVAGTVVISTVLSFATLPLLLLFVL
jgi:predicted permease